MESMPAVKSDEYRAHLCTFYQSVRDGVSKKYAKSKDAHWTIRNSHFQKFGLDLLLKTCNNPIPTLQSLQKDISPERLLPRKKTVLADYASDTLCSIHQELWGPPTLDFLILMERLISDYTNKKRSWKKDDSPPKRVKLCPVTFLL